MIEWRSILITWVVFLVLKPIAGMRSWRNAIGAAGLATVLQISLPQITGDERMQTLLTALVVAVVFAGMWLWQRQQQKPSNS